jgi:hypothetical protein
MGFMRVYKLYSILIAQLVCTYLKELRLNVQIFN